MDFFKTVDTWFLVIAVTILAAFFVWAVQYIFNGLKESIAKLGATFTESFSRLEKSITELFNHRNDHATRLVALETKCALHHNDDAVIPQRMVGGRRPYDPALVAENEH